MEARVTDGNDFIYQKAIEFDQHGDGKGQTGSHAGRIGSNGLPQIAPQFRKIIDPVDLVLKGHVVNAADEPKIV